MERANRKKSNVPLRRERQLRGWSQRKVAELVETSEDVVSRWERGERKLGPFFQEKLCALYEKSTEELGFLVEDEDDLKSLEGRKTSDTANTSLIVDLPPLPLALQEQDKEIGRLLARKVARLQHWVVDSLEEGTHLRWQLYYTSRNSLTEDGLLSQIARLEQLADDSSHYQRVCRILAQNYQLAGSLARDRFQYTKSLNYFQQAEHLDEDIHLPDLTAAALARQAVAFLRKDQKRYLKKALALYSAAVEKAEHAEAYTRAYVLSGYAEALARNSDHDACIRSLDQAEQFLSTTPHVPLEEDFAFVRLTLQSLADSRGECYVLLGKPEKGLEHLHTAQKTLDQNMGRNTCRLLMQQAEAYLAAHQPDACVQQTLKGLEIARLLESTSNIYWASEILAKLRASAFGQEPVIDELQEAIQG